MPNEYLEQVVQKLQENPTAQDIDFFIEAHSRVGYLVSVARGRAELAEATAKYKRATAYADARASGTAKSAVDAEQHAIVASFDEDQNAIRAREQFVKLTNLLNSITEAINGIKFVSRATDVSLPSLRR